MPTRKKNTVIPHQGKHKSACGEVRSEGHARAMPPSCIEAMLMVGSEAVLINHEENDNPGFMGEWIDPA